MNRLLAALALSLALAGCGVSTAPTVAPKATTQRTLKAQDINFVRSALKSVVQKEFKTLDTDQDGRLTRQELSRKSPLFLVMFQTIDLDQDGYVTYDEFMNRMSNNMEAVSRVLFSFLDANSDGVIASGDTNRMLIGFLDANNDGQVTFQEFQAFIMSPGMINTPW
ncbi:MAG TPA: EF-hand domain-containing protein [Stenomitos sp.]